MSDSTPIRHAYLNGANGTPLTFTRKLDTRCPACASIGKEAYLGILYESFQSQTVHCLECDEMFTRPTPIMAIGPMNGGSR